MKELESEFSKKLYEYITNSTVVMRRRAFRTLALHCDKQKLRMNKLDKISKIDHTSRDHKKIIRPEKLVMCIMSNSDHSLYTVYLNVDNDIFKEKDKNINYEDFFELNRFIQKFFCENFIFDQNACILTELVEIDPNEIINDESEIESDHVYPNQNETISFEFTKDTFNIVTKYSYYKIVRLFKK